MVLASPSTIVPSRLLPRIDEIGGVGIEAMLEPIPGGTPEGETLRYEGTYDAILEARREDDASLPRGVWETQLKRADWEATRRLCEEALRDKSKDLQIAVWWTEAMLHQVGQVGLEAGFSLILGLCERYWDGLHPIAEGDDMEARTAPLQWINDRLVVTLGRLTISAPTLADGMHYCWTDWAQARRNESLAPRARPEKGEPEIVLTRAKVSSSISLTSDEFYERLRDTCSGARALLMRLDRLLGELCGMDAPGFGKVREYLEGVERFAADLLIERRGEPVAAPANEAGPEEGGLMDAGDSDREEGRMESAAPGGTGPIRSRQDAYRRLDEAAEYLMRTEPHSPVPYLVKRAVAWGTLPLDRLLIELVPDHGDLGRLYELLGMRAHDEM